MRGSMIGLFGVFKFSSEVSEEVSLRFSGSDEVVVSLTCISDAEYQAMDGS
ncbi:hypothetical protein C1645_818129 [Glomus cerebriforme]|uniref:Uncharacterized protein n=1 Tax=Glomus cerebriforme TaxID=658196 RepID=A0A397THH5_9GLOM|nr:hypothetical protein C1645_818129 [Glomus cerebriforme]